jgi:hypothetical protein
LHSEAAVPSAEQLVKHFSLQRWSTFHLMASPTSKDARKTIMVANSNAAPTLLDDILMLLFFFFFFFFFFFSVYTITALNIFI